MKVSIVIPVYNEEKHLTACLDAVAAQSEAPLEVIVIDNNSSDHTAAIAADYAFVTLLHEQRQGTVFARNRGLNAAEGDIIARIDADTVLPPDWLANVRQLFQNHSGAAAITGRPDFYDVPMAGLFNQMQVLLYQRLQKLLTGSYVLWGANMAITRRAWQLVAEECTLRTDIDEDIDLSFCIRRRGLPIVYSASLPAGASLQRGQWGIRYTIRYLATWPRDYMLHRMYVRAAIIFVVMLLIEVTSLPLLLWYSIRPNLRG